jgi:hypothetical protein
MSIEQNKKLASQFFARFDARVYNNQYHFLLA